MKQDATYSAVSGILKRTATPVDRTLHVSLEGIEAMHVDWERGVPVPGRSISPQVVRSMDLSPKVITAAFLGEMPWVRGECRSA